MTEPTLDELADKLREKWLAVLEVLRENFEAARDMGEAFIEAKPMCRRKGYNWIDWCCQASTMSRRKILLCVCIARWQIPFPENPNPSRGILRALERA